MRRCARSGRCDSSLGRDRGMQVLMKVLGGPREPVHPLGRAMCEEDEDELLLPVT